MSSPAEEAAAPPLPPSAGNDGGIPVYPEPTSPSFAPTTPSFPSFIQPANPDSARTPPRFFSQPEERFRGPGTPLIQESWNYRPLSAGGLIGFVQGGTLIDDWIRQDSGLMTGVRFGWDCSYYWGIETRLAAASMMIADSRRAILAQQAADDAAGIPANDPFRRRFDGARDNDMFFMDFSALYYPWGDARCRPFVTVGMGFATFDFVDRLSTHWEGTVFCLPFGLGVKYLASECVAFRLEVEDNVAFGSGSMNLMNNLSVTAGAELRFGGSRRSYWPWNPGRNPW